MSAIFSPIEIRGTTFTNRVWVSPMCQYMAEDGFVGTWHQVHIGAWSTGAPGLIMLEATAVRPDGRISIGCPSINDDAHAQAFKPIVDFAHSYGVKVGIQLAHAGRKASTMRPWDDHRLAAKEDGGWQAISSSATAFEGYLVPREVIKEEIAELVQDFAAAAKRAVAVGIDVIEIHAAHGYLIHQFYSPLMNQRSDEYGGSFENRTRFLLEVATAVRKAIGESVPLFVRISATDWVEGGWNLSDSIELSAKLKDRGVDLIDVSSGGAVHNAKIDAKPGFQVPFAAAIKSEAGIATGAVGLITEAEQAEQIVAGGEADAVFLGRAMLRNPRWALEAAEKLGVRIDWPLPLDRGRRL